MKNSIFAGDLVNYLSTYILNMEKPENKDIPKNSFMIWGAPGLGKSDSVRKVAQIIGEKTGKEVVVNDVRLALMSQTDLRGIPCPTADRTKAVWLKPEIFDMDPSDNVINVLFLDEIANANPSVQLAAYGLILDRCVGEHTIPDNVYIIAAGNRQTDGCHVQKTSRALSNRMIHLQVECNVDDWKSWAVNSGINDKIIGFINFKNSMLNPKSEGAAKDDVAFATPRTWEILSRLLRVYNTEPENIADVVYGTVGEGPGGEFIQYCKVYGTLPDINDILAGKDVTPPTNPSAVYAICSSLSSKVTTVKPEELNNILKFTDKLSDEFAVLCVKDMCRINGGKTKLMKASYYMEWARARKKLILD